MQIGDKVKVITCGNEARHGIRTYEATISKIGRKWITVKSDVSYLGSFQFDKETGFCDGKGYISNYRLIFNEQHEKEVLNKDKYKSEIIDKIRTADFKTLEKIHTILYGI